MTACFLFGGESEAAIAAEKAFELAAKSNKNKLLFSISKSNDGIGYFERLAEFVGVDVQTVPVLMIF